jgi:hypothetical protein
MPDYAGLLEGWGHINITPEASLEALYYELIRPRPARIDTGPGPVRFIGPSRRMEVPKENLDAANRLLEFMRGRQNLDITRQREAAAQRILQGEPRGGGGMSAARTGEMPIGVPLSMQEEAPRELTQAQMVALGGAGYPTATYRNIYEGTGRGGQVKPPTEEQIQKWMHYRAGIQGELAKLEENLIGLKRSLNATDPEKNKAGYMELQQQIAPLEQEKQRLQEHDEYLQLLIEQYGTGSQMEPIGRYDMDLGTVRPR